MSVYITGDTHGCWSSQDAGRFTNNTFNKEDILIILGDFGFLFGDSIQTEIDRIKSFKDLVKCEILFIDGNHENFDKLKELKILERYKGEVGKVIKGVYHLKRGEIYTIKDKTFFCMGGAESVDKEKRIDGVTWWNEENINYQEINNALNNFKKYGDKVDYVLTHTCPNSIIDKLYSKKYRYNDINGKVLEEFKNMLKFRYWYFGHLHTNVAFNNFYGIYTEIIKLF